MKLRNYIIPALMLILITHGDSRAQITNVVIDAVGQFVICGVENGKWIAAEEAGKDITGGFNYNLYNFEGFIGTVYGDRPQTYGMPCEWLFEVPLREVPDEESLVGIHCDWEPQPRKPEVLPVSNSAYEKIIGEHLEMKGIHDPDIVIKQILRVDLEGDGKNEVLISASRFIHDVYPPVSPGDYSIILLRKVINEKAFTIPVFEEYYPDGDTDHIIPSESRISALLDTNGDGVMEIIIDTWYYEGSNKAVFQIRENELELVAAEGCGV